MLSRAVRCALLLLLLGGLALASCSPPQDEPRMGEGMQAMTGPLDPSYRVVTGQVMSIDTDLGTQGGLSVLLRGNPPDWAKAAAKIDSIERSWRDVRMELERRNLERPEAGAAIARFDWYFNVLNTAIREKNRANANAALTELLATWEQAKAPLRQPQVDVWRVVTVVVGLIAFLIIATDLVLWVSRRVDRKFIPPPRKASGEPPAGGPQVPGLEPVSRGGGPAVAVAEAVASQGLAGVTVTVDPPSYGFDLLRVRPIRAIARSRYFPLTFQLFLLVVFAWGIYGAFVGMDMRESNFGVLMFWSIFWPSAIMLSLVTLGKVWCGVCPLGALSAAAQRFGLNRPLPQPLRSGIIALVLYVVAVWLIREPLGVVEDGNLTGWFFVLFALGAVGVGLIFRNRTWCQSFCPIGIVSGLWSMLSFMELRTDRTKCDACRTNECFRGSGEVRGCPMGIHPGRIDSNRDCIYCMNCVKTCPNDSPKIRLRWPGSELEGGRQRYIVDALFALWVVIVLNVKENMEHYYTPPFLQDATTWVQRLVGTADRQAVWFYVVVAFSGLLLMGAYLLATLVGSRTLGWTRRRTFATFGYAFVPIVLVTIGGHSLNAIFTMFGGALVSMSEAQVGVYQYVDASFLGPGLAKFVGDGFMRPVLYAIGFAWMIVLPYRIARRGGGSQKAALRAAIPFALIAVTLATFFIGSHMILTGGMWRW